MIEFILSLHAVAGRESRRRRSESSKVGFGRLGESSPSRAFGRGFSSLQACQDVENRRLYTK